MADTGKFRALVLDEKDGAVVSRLRTLDDDQLPPGDVVVRVVYSDLNFKDGLILKGLGKLVRTYPHIPGIDFAGVVERSESAQFKPGDEVILTGWRVGEVHWGGYATRARVKSDWLVPLPPGMTLEQAMALGTAGFTAMLAVMALEEHGLKPASKGDVLVTGASGGVGSVAVALLASLGYRVAAVTGRAEAHEYLKGLGATTIVERADMATTKGPLGKELWSGAIDNVGGDGLGAIFGGLCYWGSCAAVGNASGHEFKASVLPFLLRGVNLLGIDSATCPTDRRMIAWSRLSREMPKDKLKEMTQKVGLTDASSLGGDIIKGKVRGRTVIDVNA
jgi:acrylyl-CoA reductase (NADPH)